MLESNVVNDEAYDPKIVVDGHLHLSVLVYLDTPFVRYDPTVQADTRRERASRRECLGVKIPLRETVADRECANPPPIN